MAEFQFPYFTSDDGRVERRVISVEADTYQEAFEKALKVLHENC